MLLQFLLIFFALGNSLNETQTQTYSLKELHYPKEALETGVSGDVVCTIKKDGDVKFVTNSFWFGTEVLRHINTWKHQFRGKEVLVHYNFSLRPANYEKIEKTYEIKGLRSRLFRRVTGRKVTEVWTTDQCFVSNEPTGVIFEKRNNVLFFQVVENATCRDFVAN